MGIVWEEHTPEPWTVLEGVPNGGGIGIGPELDGIGPHAIITFNGGASEANAKRIVDCVNALAGHDPMVVRSWLRSRK